jgi:GTPase
VGFPNAGKSSLTTLITNAHPKTAPYPFTTLHPQIGVINYPEQYDKLVMADVPGLIAGASDGKGLGHRFLRHIERCKLLLILLDMAGTDQRDPRDDYKQLLKELELYDDSLLEKPRLVVANKLDEDTAVANLVKFKKRYPKVEIMPISCLTEEGIPKLRKELLKRVKKMRTKEKKSPKAPTTVS